MTRIPTDVRADGVTVAHSVRPGSRRLVWQTLLLADKKKANAVLLVPFASTPARHRDRSRAGARAGRGHMVGPIHVSRAGRRAGRSGARGRRHDRRLYQP